MSASPTWDASQERLVFLSLHDVKVAITAEIFRSSEELEKVITNKSLSDAAAPPFSESRSQRFASQIACRYATAVQTSVEFRSGIQRGGAYRDRTGDLMLAKHALSQLS